MKQSIAAATPGRVTSALVLAFTIAAGCGSSTSPKADVGLPPKPRVWVAQTTGYGAMTALMEGTVVYDRANDCFQLVTRAATYPIVWPHGAQATANPTGVVLEDGSVVHDGQTVSLGGGYVNVADRYDIPASCVPPTGEVAVIQTTR